MLGFQYMILSVNRGWRGLSRGLYIWTGQTQSIQWQHTSQVSTFHFVSLLWGNYGALHGIRLIIYRTCHMITEHKVWNQSTYIFRIGLSLIILVVRLMVGSLARFYFTMEVTIIKPVLKINRISKVKIINAVIISWSVFY